jgi:hypothetical protein
VRQLLSNLDETDRGLLLLTPPGGASRVGFPRGRSGETPSTWAPFALAVLTCMGQPVSSAISSATRPFIQLLAFDSTSVRASLFDQTSRFFVPI